MKIKLLQFFLCCFGPVLACAQIQMLGRFESISLKNLSGELFSFRELKKNTATVIVFLLPDCPACQSYSTTLNKLNEQYQKDGVAFYGVFPGTYNTLEEMNEFKNTYHIKFPLLCDPDKKLVKTIAAKVTPEVFVLNHETNIVYRGRIDDWMYALGKKKPVITTHELADALHAVVHHQPAKVSQTTAIGCIIE